MQIIKTGLADAVRLSKPYQEVKIESQVNYTANRQVFTSG